MIAVQLVHDVVTRHAPDERKFLVEHRKGILELFLVGNVSPEPLSFQGFLHKFREAGVCLCLIFGEEEILGTLHDGFKRDLPESGIFAAITNGTGSPLLLILRRRLRPSPPMPADQTTIASAAPRSASAGAGGPGTFPRSVIHWSFSVAPQAPPNLLVAPVKRSTVAIVRFPGNATGSRIVSGSHRMRYFVSRVHYAYGRLRACSMSPSDRFQ